LVLWNSWNSYGQTEAKKLEEEIKISGNYFYGQGYAASEIVAEKKALDLLMADPEFQNFLKEANLDLQNVKVNYLSFLLETSFKVIAYHPKGDVKVIPNEALKKNSFVENIQEKSNNFNSRKEDTVNSIDVTSKSFELPFELQSLSGFVECEEIWIQLQKLNKEGVLVFSRRKDAFDDLQDCYMVICFGDKVQFILGKEISSKRYDYLTKKELSVEEYSTDNNLYIYVYVF
jgi:hypothetical protein